MSWFLRCVAPVGYSKNRPRQNLAGDRSMNDPAYRLAPLRA